MSGPLRWIGRHAAAPAPETTGPDASAVCAIGAHTPATVAEDDGGRTYGRAVQAARTLLDTLAGSSEGVSLVSVITEAILRNRDVDMGDDASIREPGETTGTGSAASTAGKDDDPAGATATGTETGTRGRPDDDTGGDHERAGVGADGDGSGTGPWPGDSTDGDDEDGNPGITGDDDGREGNDDADGDGENGNDPETEERYTGQFGARVPEYQTYYPDLETFVEKIIAKVFLHHQSATKHFKWVKDWWNYPALVFPLDAIWRSYETSRRAPGQMMVWYMQANSLLNQIFNSDEGIVASLDVPPLTTTRGESMPCERPPRGWRARIVNELAPETARRHRVRVTTVHSKENER